VSEQPDTLDQQRWVGLCDRLGARGSGSSIFAHLSAAYAEPGRTYHTAKHIRDCLSELDRARQCAHRPDEVEAALWFHDAVYVPGGSDNEEESAQLAEGALIACGVPATVAGRIADLVRATRHLALSRDPDTQLLCDVDLSILGRAPDVFDDFERRIREEYDWVPEPVYRSSRSEILSGFLQRHFIYQTDFFRERYEATARANLERLLGRLAR
jgi:predicted metal-dependent HD superfamily phosphohydrolase